MFFNSILMMSGTATTTPISMLLTTSTGFLSQPASLAIDYTGQNIIIGGSAPGSAYPYVSNNYGVNFSLRGNKSAAWYGSAISASGLIMYSVDGGNNGGNVIKSTDGGLTWTQVLVVAGLLWRDIACSSNGRNVYAHANGGKIYESFDAGATWNYNNNYPANYKYSISVSDDGTKILYRGSNAANTVTRPYLSLDGGITTTVPTIMNYQSAAWSTCMTPDGTKMVVVARDTNKLYMSVDGGVNWVENAGYSALGAAYSGYCSISHNGQSIMVGSYTTGAVYVSYDTGATWTSLNWYHPLVTNTGVCKISGDGSHCCIAAWNGPIYIGHMGIPLVPNNPFINPGFEVGDLTGWAKTPLTTAAYVDASLVRTTPSPDYTYTPQAGTKFLIIPSDVTTPDVLQTVTQTVSLTAGQLLTGMAAFAWGDVYPQVDGIQVQIYQGATLVATPYSDDSTYYADYDNGTWSSWAWPVPTTGTYTIVYSVVSTAGSTGTSYGLFDKLLVDGV